MQSNPFDLDAYMADTSNLYQFNYYVVAKGRKIGIYSSWKKMKKYVDKFSGALFKKFSNIEEAKQYFLEKSGVFKQKKHENYLNLKNKAFLANKPIKEIFCVGSLIYYKKEWIRVELSEELCFDKNKEKIIGLYAIKKALELINEENSDNFFYTIRSCSEYSIRCIRVWNLTDYRITPAIQSLVQQAKELFENLKNKCEIVFHSCEEGNEKTEFIKGNKRNNPFEIFGETECEPEENGKKKIHI